MKVSVKCFGVIAEVVNSADVLVPLENNSISSLKKELERTFPPIAGLSYQIAINQKLADRNQRISEEDEIAVLPPFAGG